MNEEKISFADMMSDLQASAGMKFIHAEGTTDWTVPVEGGAVEVNVSLRPTGQVVTFAEVCPFIPSPDDAGRARMLLEMNWRWKESRGFTISVDDETDRLMIADRRPARGFASAEALGNYLFGAAELVKELRDTRADFEDLALAEVVDGTDEDNAAETEG